MAGANRMLCTGNIKNKGGEENESS
jgi:hypothetical protein